MLKLENLNAWYDRSHVIQGVALEVKAGEIVTLMGRNGAGKTTTLRSIMGLVAKRQGSVLFDGREILPGLSVRENLRLGLIASAKRKQENELIERIARTFPRIKERLDQEGTSLSGGEQQMLAIARAMMASPKMILLDEPSEGIMPLLVDEMFELFAQMKREGTTILLVEQNVERALSLSDRAYIMDQGVIVHHDTAANLLADKAIQERYCAV